MKELFYRPLFLFFLFILFFFILNIFILPILDNVTVLSSFVTMYTFWAIIIIFLFFISRTLVEDEPDRDENV